MGIEAVFANGWDQGGTFWYMYHEFGTPVPVAAGDAAPLPLDPATDPGATDFFEYSGGVLTVRRSGLMMAQFQLGAVDPTGLRALLTLTYPGGGGDSFESAAADNASNSPTGNYPLIPVKAGSAITLAAVNYGATDNAVTLANIGLRMILLTVT